MTNWHSFKPATPGDTPLFYNSQCFQWSWMVIESPGLFPTLHCCASCPLGIADETAWSFNNNGMLMTWIRLPSMRTINLLSLLCLLDQISLLPVYSHLGSPLYQPSQHASHIEGMWWHASWVIGVCSILPLTSFVPGWSSSLTLYSSMMALRNRYMPVWLVFTESTNCQSCQHCNFEVMPHGPSCETSMSYCCHHSINGSSIWSIPWLVFCKYNPLATINVASRMQVHVRLRRTPSTLLFASHTSPLGPNLLKWPFVGSSKRSELENTSLVVLLDVADGGGGGLLE